MSATVVTFRRDLKKALQELITFDSDISLDELHRRHEQIRQLRAHAYDQYEAGLIKNKEIWPITGAMDQMHIAARRNGVPEAVIEQFNEDRWDYVMYREMRANMPANMRFY